MNDRQPNICQHNKRLAYTGLRSLRLILLSLVLLTLMAAPARADVQDIRVWQSPQSTRLVLDLTEQTDHKIFTLQNPNRVVIDLPNTRIKTSTAKVDLDNTSISRIRTGRPQSGTTRIVLDLKETLVPNSFPLPPNQQYPNHRLVIDLERQATTAILQPRKEKNATSSSGSNRIVKTAPATSARVVKSRDDLAKSNRDIIIAIDAGHGGEDPGAIGSRKKIKEKHVVMAIAKALEKELKAAEGYTPFMVRTGDYYIGLRERSQKAREANADFFVSIHADSFPHPSAHGSSVYVLSDSGASSETASWLADNENKADLVGGVHLQGQDDHVRMTLLDLSMTHKRTTSKQIGTHILQRMGKVSHLHKKQVEEAAFVVLKSPDVPALLVETGFISNPKEEKNLASSRYQKQMANAIFTGILRYFEKHPPDGTLIAKRAAERATMKAYTVRSGDTLSEIAARNGVAIAELRRLNALKNDRIRVGQTLTIPST